MRVHARIVDWTDNRLPGYPLVYLGTDRESEAQEKRVHESKT